MAQPRMLAEVPAFDVAVNAAQPARTPFSYSVPAGMSVETGQAVFVPFGSRILQGVVTGPSHAEAPRDLRPISAIADPEPLLDGQHLALAQWMSDAYLAPLWECVAVNLPAGYGQKPVTMVTHVEAPALFSPNVRDQELLLFVAEHGRVSIDTLRKAVSGVTSERLQRLQAAGFISVAQGLSRPLGHPKFERRIRLTVSTEQAQDRAVELSKGGRPSVAARVLALLAGCDDLSLKEVHAAGANLQHLRALEKDGWLTEYRIAVDRDPLAGRAYAGVAPLVLTADQQAAVSAIPPGPGVHLLHGVTGSGKTEVYIALIERAFAAGQGAIVLVPEIALAPQAVRRYGERFGDAVAVLHSELNTGQLFDQWFRIKRGEARLVVGSRSALFAPVQDLGLVVIDEEHEWTYKQSDPQPRYHARETAVELCRLAGATLVLGSATPDVVTYHGSETGRLHRVELNERVAPGLDGATSTGTMPDITVVDMREELKAGNRSVFSVPLKRAIRRALQDGEQAILFVNRRGSARFLLCRSCGFVARCPTCDVPLSMDAIDSLNPVNVCHQCGRSRKMEEKCPSCSSTRFRPFGVGTQRIEVEAHREFGSARIARWDSDVTTTKGAHERLLERLEGREIDILVGTQMLAKGLDLPGMTVVGVVDADIGLNMPDYHAHERVFQLLSQVAGRAGRRGRRGEVFIQTYNADAVPIVAAAAHDYRGLYEHEIAHRRRAGYPPFSRLAHLVHRSADKEGGLQEATRVAMDLRVRRDAAGWSEPEILGPTAAFIPRLRGDWRWQILLRGRNPAQLLSSARLGPRWTIDIDPASMLT